ncbi:hypothetical protein AUG19_01000 [archaeon 13_1_20CM_2_54_9]|nr:MAG: hypothetical protein AUG19_01000 [archaeon 13_1_20CM_2_54_9]
MVSKRVQALADKIIELATTLCESTTDLRNFLLQHRGALTEPVQLDDDFLDSEFAQDKSPY